MVLGSARYPWAGFCWVLGLVYALASILISFVCLVGVVLWHGPGAAVSNAELRYLTLSLVAMIVMTTATSAACFSARYVQRLTATWICLHLAAVMSSFVVV